MRQLSLLFSVNLPFKTDGCKERAEEDSGIRVALPGKQRQPACALLHGLSRRLVAQQVGHPHSFITNVLAQGHACWDGDAAGGTPGLPQATFTYRKHRTEASGSLTLPPHATVLSCCSSHSRIICLP